MKSDLNSTSLSVESWRNCVNNSITLKLAMQEWRAAATTSRPPQSSPTPTSPKAKRTACHHSGSQWWCLCGVWHVVKVSKTNINCIYAFIDFFILKAAFFNLYLDFLKTLFLLAFQRRPWTMPGPVSPFHVCSVQNLQHQRGKEDKHAEDHHKKLLEKKIFDFLVSKNWILFKEYSHFPILC